jgi:hypothetical protein
MNMYLKVVAGMMLTGVLTGVLAGCSQKQDETAVASVKAAKPASSQSQSSAAPFVKAVTVTVGESPIELHFELPQRPLANQPVPVNLRLTGLVDTTAVSVTTTGNDRIQVLEGADWSVDALPAGQAQVHGITVKSKTTGVAILDVAVEATRDNFAKSYAFAIPVAVVESAAESSAASH